ncbi:MAG TPA: cupredoxin domain-containing protein [Candidatus Limnocylindria bacterium]
MIPTVSRRLLPAALLSALVLAACSTGPTTTPLPSGAEPPSDCARVENGVINIGARDLGFTQPCMVANAGEAFTIHFTNADAMPHNISIYEDSSKANEIMRGETQTGSGEIDYDVDALDAGQYYFDCIIHPADMNGTLYVV